MSIFSKPELKKQADELYAQIFAGLKEAGVKASMNENMDGVKIPEYFYVIASVEEVTRGTGFSIIRTGKLEVVFRSIYLKPSGLCHAKRFKADTKDLVKKVVASIKERRDAIVAEHAREKAETKAHRTHEATLKGLRKDFPRFKDNIGNHRSLINLNFHDLTEDQARLILMTLRNAGIKGEDNVQSED